LLVPSLGQCGGSSMHKQVRNIHLLLSVLLTDSTVFTYMDSVEGGVATGIWTYGRFAWFQEVHR